MDGRCGSERKRLKNLAQSGSDIGPSACPNARYSWDGPFNGQTTVNGGVRDRDWIGSTLVITMLVQLG